MVKSLPISRVGSSPVVAVMTEASMSLVMGTVFWDGMGAIFIFPFPLSFKFHSNTEPMAWGFRFYPASSDCVSVKSTIWRHRAEQKRAIDRHVAACRQIALLNHRIVILRF